MTEQTRLEPTLLGALLRFWRTALATAVLVAVATTLIAAASASQEHFADSSMVLADPRDDLLFESGDQVRQSEYVADQVDILSSAEIARRAADQALQADDSFPYDTLEMLDRITVSGGDGGALVQIRFQAESEQWAVTGANAVTAAYRDFLSTQNQDRFAASIDVLDTSLAQIDDQIAATRDAIDAQISQGPEADAALLAEVTAEVARLPALQDELAATDDPDTELALRAEIEDIRTLVDTTATVLSFRQTSPALTVLNQRLNQLVAQEGSLSERRQNLTVDSQLLENGVRFDTPAIVAESSGVGNIRTIAASGFLGVIAGLSAAYALALRTRRFKTRTEAGLVASAPVIAAFPLVPDDAMVGVVRSGRLPGASRETFFGPTLETLGRWIKDNDDDRGVVVGVTGTGHGGGTSTIVGSVARAAVDAGHLTLVIDGDMGVRDLTRMVAPDALDSPGLIDLAEGTATTDEAVVSVAWGGAGFDVVSRGAGEVGDDFFRREGTLRTIVGLAAGYDLVLLDLPPVFNGQDAATVAGASDRVIVVVGHGVQVGDLERVRDDFGIVGGEIDGLIYNREPVGRASSRGGALNALRQS